MARGGETGLSVQGLTTVLHLDGGPARAVSNVDFELAPGETLGIVGESGCGKSMLALSLLGLVPDPPAEVVEGVAWFEGENLLALPPARLRQIRGRRIAMIFQEPMTALNPVMTVGRQISEVCQRHLGLGHAAAWRRAVEMLERARVPDPERRAHDYPHRLSGGMRQRAMIAIALSCDPAILIADEPTTALDVTIQSQILDLIRELQEQNGMGLILITHDLGVIAETADRVMVMYAGRKVEEAGVDEIFAGPLHPYARGLLESVPVIGQRRDGRLREIVGVVPPIAKLPPGCAFAARCPRASGTCRRDAPELLPVSGARAVACHHPEAVRA